MKIHGPDPFLDRMERALDVMSRRQQLVATNVGNVDTPGYRTQDIDFKAALARAVKAQAARTARQEAPRVQHVAHLATRNDGNDVNVEREMLAMAETRAKFDVTSSIARLRIKQLITAIEEGRSS